MPKKYTRLTKDERYQIYEDKLMEFSHRKTAQNLNRHDTAISREIKCNKGLQEENRKTGDNRPDHGLRAD